MRNKRPLSNVDKILLEDMRTLFGRMSESDVLASDPEEMCGALKDHLMFYEMEWCHACDGYRFPWECGHRNVVKSLPTHCWRCSLEFKPDEARCVDHDGASHYDCIKQTFDQKIKIPGPDGKHKVVDRPGRREISERWDGAVVSQKPLIWVPQTE